MSLRVARSLAHMIPEVSPPDDPEVPHEWVAEAWSPSEKEMPALRAEMAEVVRALEARTGCWLPSGSSTGTMDHDYFLRVSCRHCRTVCLAGFGRTPSSLVAAITLVRCWPVDPSCLEALARAVMES